MGYSIFYDKQFIKAEKNNEEVFFPMVYGGSSNCYEVGKNNRCGRRERSWFNFQYILKKKYGTLNEMLNNISKERENVILRNKETNEEYIKNGNPNYVDEYSDKRWGYFTAISFGGGCKVTYGQYKGLAITGCKKALTVEELKEFGVSVHIYTSIHSKEDEENFKKAGKQEINFYPTTSKELIEKIDEFEEYVKDFPNVSLYVTINADERTMTRIRRKKFPTKKNAPVFADVEEYFVILVVNVGYFYKKTRNGFKYSPYQDGGKLFASQKAASKQKKRFEERYGNQYSVVIENVKRKTRLKV